MAKEIIYEKIKIYSKRRLEKLIVEKLQHIYRKNNLITHIEIEDDFQFNLYQNVKYSARELLHLMKNLGREVFAAEIGYQGMQFLFEKYKVESVLQLQHALEADKKKHSYDMFKRIDISRLSKGCKISKDSIPHLFHQSFHH